MIACVTCGKTDTGDDTGITPNHQCVHGCKRPHQHKCAFCGRLVVVMTEVTTMDGTTNHLMHDWGFTDLTDRSLMREFCSIYCRNKYREKYSPTKTRAEVIKATRTV